MEHKLFLRIAAIMLTIFFFAGCGKKPMPSVAKTAPSTAEPTPVPTEPMPTAPVIDQAACYEAAWAAVEAGDLPLAYRMFTLAGDYSDAKACLERFVIQRQTSLTQYGTFRNPDEPDPEDIFWTGGHKEWSDYDDRGRLVYNCYVTLKPVADGSLVERDQKTETFREYDDKGRLVASGNDHSRYTYTYDDHGNKTLEQQILADGTLKKEIRWEYTYSSSGAVLMVVENCWDTWSTGGYIYEENARVYNESGNEIERREKQWHSSGADWASVNCLIVWEYDDAGRMILRKQTDGQGVDETTYVYDGQGQLVEQRRDRNGDTWVTTKEYDGAGREVLHREEKTAAGKTTTTWEQKRTTYDENGNILSQVREYGSSVSEQAWKTETATYVYNEAGLCVEHFVELCYGDQGQQQENGYSTRILNEYDAAGRLLRKETDYRKAGDPAAEGSYLTVVSYTYDARGNLIREEETKPLPGAEAYKVIYVNTWEYDEDGILLRGGERTFPGGGERLEIREYDAAGNVTLAVTKDSDGVQRSEFTYAWFFLPEAATP